MKIVKSGFMYDTENSKLIYSFVAPGDPRGVNFEKEELFQTKKGAFFLVGSGGAGTKYHVGYGKDSMGGTLLSTLTEQEAMTWLEDHGASTFLIANYPLYVKEA